MRFPLINISSKKLDEDAILFDDKIYNGSEDYFNSTYLNQQFCDCNGKVFRVIGKTPNPKFWRRLLGFLPNINQIQLNFETTGKSIELRDFKEDIIERIKSSYPYDDYSRKWINKVLNASSYEEILLMEDS